MSGNGTGAGPAPPTPPPAWVVEDAWEARNAWQALPEASSLGIVNGDAVQDEQRRRWQERHGTGDTFYGTFRYDSFAAVPHVVAPVSLALDWIWYDGLTLVSPRLFALLDQPTGSLQALPTRTEWAGPDAPAWSYLWLSHVPRVPALDLDRCAGDVEWITRDGGQMRVLRPGGGGQRLRLRFRSSFIPPCGLFWPAEAITELMASDTLAEAVQRAGCTGLEFLHPEAPSPGEDDCLRRTLDGVKPHPRGVARREAHAKALLEPPPGPAFTLPPPGPPLHWAQSALDLIQWNYADTELRAFMAGGDGRKDYASLLCSLLDPGIGSSQRTVWRVVDAIADAKAGRAEIWSEELPDEIVVTVRRDAVWIYWDHAHPDKRLRPFPLDGMEAVLRRWAEAIQRHDE